MEEINCLVCKNQAKNLSFGGYQYKDKIYALYECSACGLRFIFPQPTASEADLTYNDISYWQSGDFAGDKTNYDIYKKQYKKDAEKIIKLIKKYNIKQENFLEIGCAQGDLLKELSPYFKKVVGLDVSAPMIKLAREKGLDARLGKIGEIKFAENFNCIYLGDLIEHLAGPVVFFNHLKKIIKKDGLVIIEIPLTYNIYPANLFLSPLVFIKNLLKGIKLTPSSLIFFSSTQREKNKKINHYPYHLLEFTPKSARNFVNLIGWQIAYDHVYSGWPKRKYFGFKNFHLVALQIIFYFITKYKSFFDLGDRMTIVIRLK